MMPAIRDFAIAALGGPATAVLTLSGAASTVVPDGSQITRDADSSVWTLDGSVTIGGGGTALGAFVRVGPQTVSAGESWTIATPVAGWASVSDGPAAPISFPWTVVFARQDGDDRVAPAPPAKPFAIIQFLELPAADGRQWAEAFDTSPTTLRVAVRNLGILRAQIQLFADEERRVEAERLRLYTELQWPTADNLAAAGLAIVPSEVRMRDLSEIFSGELEFRYMLEVAFRLETRLVIEEYPWVETVEVELDVD